MTIGKPEVWMICMTDHPLSMYYRGRVEESWTSRGFKINISEAVTPSTLNLYDNRLTFKLLDGIRSGYRYIKRHPRNLTDGEKSIWFSHLNLWKYAAKREEPTIIIEHDAYLKKDIPDNFFKESIIVAMSHKEKTSNDCPTYPAAAYYITRSGAKELIRIAKQVSEQIGISSPVDSFLYRLIDENRYCRFESSFVKQIENLGTTLDHHLLQEIDYNGNLI